MTTLPKLTFIKPETPERGVAIVIAGEDAALGPRARALDEAAGGALQRAIRGAGFKGKRKTSLDLYAPANLAVDRILVLGLGEVGKLDAAAWLSLGGLCIAKLTSEVPEAMLLAELPDGSEVAPESLAQFGLGAKLAAYRFAKYKTHKKDDEPQVTNPGMRRYPSILQQNRARLASGPTESG